MPRNKTETLARKLALEWLNQNLAADGKPALPRLSPLWWRMYGNEWLAKAQAQKFAKAD